MEAFSAVTNADIEVAKQFKDAFDRIKGVEDGLKLHETVFYVIGGIAAFLGVVSFIEIRVRERIHLFEPPSESVWMVG